MLNTHTQCTHTHAYICTHEYAHTQVFITKPRYCVPFLQPGRLVKVAVGSDDFGWGSIVNFQKKTNQKVWWGVVKKMYSIFFVITSLMCCDCIIDVL